MGTNPPDYLHAEVNMESFDPLIYLTYENFNA